MSDAMSRYAEELARYARKDGPRRYMLSDHDAMRAAFRENPSISPMYADFLEENGLHADDQTLHHLRNHGGPLLDWDANGKVFVRPPTYHAPDRHAHIRRYSVFVAPGRGRKYSERGDPFDDGYLSPRAWLRQSPVNHLLPAAEWNLPDKRDQAELGEMHPEAGPAGLSVFAVGDEPPGDDTLNAGGGRHTSLLGLNNDGTVAIVQHGEEWRPTADGLYPWPTMSNAL